MFKRFHFAFLVLFIFAIGVLEVQGKFDGCDKSDDASLSEYKIKTYEPGFEAEHEKIALANSKEWAWPFLSFTDIYSQPDFDPETALSCFKGDTMVGFVLVKIMGEGPGILKNEGMGAYLDIPRVLPGYEEAADLLMGKIIKILKAKGARFIRTRVSTMRKNSLKLAEKWGFQPHKDFPLGYKIYYTYNLGKGKLNYSTNDIESFNKERDLKECVERVSHYFKMPKDRVKEWLLEVDSREDLISHIVIRKNGRLEAYSFALPHHFNKNIMATIYMDASNETYLKQLITQTIADGIERKHELFLVDIIGHLLKYKETVASLGFENAATWGIYELILNSSFHGNSHRHGHLDDWPVLQGPFFGQKAPSGKAEVFMDGIISRLKDDEMCAAFTEDGKEFYFNAYHEGNWAIFMTKEVDGRWTRPAPMPFTSDYTDRDFTLSPDGNKILFGSNRPRSEEASSSESLDIFVTERLPTDRWSEPRNIGYPINTDRGENYPSVAHNGNLYFFTYREDGSGGCDIYVSRLVDGRYQPPENLGPAINSDKHDWDSYIAPDESYIIFSSKDREDSIGGQDLYISYRKKDGGWTRAKNMGSSVNSPSGEICPSVSLDGKYFFFTSRRRGKADIFWMTADIIEKFRPAKENEFPILNSPYLGQKPPGMTPVIFAPGIISTEENAEYGGHFSPAGNEFYFTRHAPGEPGKLWVTEYRKNKWRTPREVSFIEEFPGVESCFSPDGKKFYYVWMDTSSKEFVHDIFVVEISKNEWGTPHQLTKTDLGTRRMSPSIALNGNLYFSGDFDQPGQKDIYCAKLINEKYSEPQNLGKTVNSEYHEEHVFVSPDESYILFDSYRPSEYGRSDIYVSCKMGDGTWSEAQNLGPLVNSEHYDWYPSVTPDGRYIIFSRTLPAGKIDLYWVDAKIIEDLKPEKLK